MPVIIAKKNKRLMRRGARYIPPTQLARLANKKANIALKKIKQNEPELKHYDYSWTGAAMGKDNTGGAAAALELSIPAQINQGSGDNNRIGDSIHLKKLYLNGEIARNGADCTVTILVFLDKQPRGVPSTVINLFQGAGNANAPHTPKRWDSRFTTTVLYRKTLNVNTNSPNRLFRARVKIDKKLQYEAGGNTIDSNDLRMIFISDQGLATEPTLYASARLTYLDN